MMMSKVLRYEIFNNYEMMLKFLRAQLNIKIQSVKLMGKSLIFVTYKLIRKYFN